MSLTRYAPMKKRGKRTLAWEACRRKLKREFEAAGITACENCGGTYNLGFAHRFKRRFITTAEELRTVALLDQRCHDRFERIGHYAMFHGITRIITDAGRTVPATLPKP